MTGNNKLYAAAIILSIIFGLANSGLHPVTPNSGYTGAPGDSNCSTCHNGNNPSLDGNITLSGLPSTIIRNQTYRLTVRITNPNGNARKAGFQLVALTGSNANAGSMENNTPGTDITTVFGGRTYFGHAPAATFTETKEVAFSVDWKAPSTIPNNSLIKFYASGIIADGNDSNSLDRVVLTIRQISIQNNAPLSINISNVTGTSCSDSSDGAAAVFATGGSGNYTYYWSNGATNTINSALSAGVNKVTIKDSDGDSTVVSVNIPSPPEILLYPKDTYACNGINNGKTSINAIGGTGLYSYLWSTGATTANISQVASGQYQVTVTDQNGCSKNTSTSIVAAPEILIEGDIRNPSCNNQNNGEITLNTSGGSSQFLYEWSNGEKGLSLKNLETNIFTVTVTDSIGCIKTKSFQITAPESISGKINALKDVSCFGLNDGSISIAASGGNPDYTFNWSNGTFFSGNTSTVNNLKAGLYQVTITDLFDCFSKIDININEPPLISIEEDIKHISCFGGNDASISINTKGTIGAPLYSWSNMINDVSIKELTTGTYTVTVTDTGTGCNKEKTYEITQPKQLVLHSAVKNDITCFGGRDGRINIITEGGTGFHNFVWSNGQTTSEIEKLISGEYGYSITDEKGCNIDGTIVLNEPEQLKITLDTIINPICAEVGNGYISIKISNAVGDYSVLWSNEVNTLENHSLFAGKYKVLVSDTNNCMASDSFTITAGARFMIPNAVIDHVKCYGESTGSAYILPDEQLKYEWSTGSFGPAINKVKSGNYSVTATDRNGCKSLPESFTISQPPPLQISIDTAVVEICPGSKSGFININTKGGKDSLEYKWNNGSNTKNIANLGEGSYTVSVTDINQCLAIDSFKISNTESIIITDKEIQDVHCSDNGNASIRLIVKGGVGTLDYFWSDPSLKGSSVTGLTRGTYKVTITDMKHCSVQDSFKIEQLDSLSVTESVTHETIAGKYDGKISLQISGGKAPFLILWNNGRTGPKVENLAPGWYTYIIEDANKCQKSGYAIVGGGLCSLSATATTKPATCFNSFDGKIDLKINGIFSNYTLDLSTSEGQVNYPLDSLPPGKYTIIVGDSLDCVAFVSGIVIGSVNPPIILENIEKVSPTSSVLKNGSLEASVSGGKSPFRYEWYKDGQIIGTDKKLNNVSIGIYNLIVVDSFGCMLRINSIFLSLTTSVEDEITAVIKIYPNPVTDFLYVENLSGLPMEALQVYNSSGKMIFQTFLDYKQTNYYLDTRKFIYAGNGMYLIRFKLKDRWVTKKVIITN